MQPKRSLGNLSAVGMPSTAATLRSALTSQQQQQAYPFGYQAPLELYQRKRSIALLPNKSVAAQQHEQFLRDWQHRGKQKNLFSRAATLDYEANDYYEEEEYYPEVNT
jgi:hypothetical protein